MSRHIVMQVVSGATLWLAAFGVSARGAGETLQGCWRVERSVLHFQDGTTAETHAYCVTRYGERGFVTVCADPQGVQPDARMEGRYEQIGDGTYVATLTRHSRLPGSVGKRSTVHFHIGGGRLVTTTYPPRLPGMRQVVSIEASAVRMRDEDVSFACPEAPSH